MQLAVRAMFRIDTNKEHILIIEHLEKTECYYQMT
jgi:hypothetical protein